MKESINNAFVFNMVIFFLTVIIAILVGSLSYSKAFKVKSKIVDIIEKHQAYNSKAKTEIDEILKEMGYKTNPGGKNVCPGGHGTLVTPRNSNFRYCVYQNNEHNGFYFTVASFVYFEIPVIGDILEFPVYGDT
ncbi:MAG: hypothetical protein PHE05_04485, partial [Bacilli bacterium]|nr:hypothetical protein [Bacilli bacterium]